jgi:hypothetical protein
MSKRHIVSVVRNAAAGCSLLCLAWSAPAVAAEPVLPAEQVLARAALPYSPLLFDLIVASARSFAEISYDSRGYDAVTNTFFVSGLRVRRYAVDVAIDRLRTDLTTYMLEGVAVDTRGLDLPPPFRAALRRLGGNPVEGNILIGVEADAPRRGYDLTVRIDLPEAGAVELAASFDGLHVLIPIPSSNTSGYSPDPTVTGTLTSASIAYQDHGLMKVAYDMAAQQAGIPPEQFKAGLFAMPQQLAAQFIQRLPGGASDQMRPRIQGWAAVAEEFLREEDGIRVSLTPAEPVQLSRLQTGYVDEALIVALNPDATPAFEAPLAPPAPAGTLEAADAAITGASVPQDRAAGARALLALAAAGNSEAVAALAERFGQAPAPALETAEIAQLYGYLLIARALGERVDDHALSVLTSGLTREDVLAAERSAATWFAGNGGTPPLDTASIGDYDADSVRAAAYDFYEGRAVPRDYTRALSLALVASAAGDVFAGRLRDDLTAAAERGAIVLDDPAARSEAASLWTAYAAARQ